MGDSDLSQAGFQRSVLPQETETARSVPPYKDFSDDDEIVRVHAEAYLLLPLAYRPPVEGAKPLCSTLADRVQMA